MQSSAPIARARPPTVSKKNILSRKRGDLFLPESYIGWKEKIAARKQTPSTRLKPGRQNRIPPFSSDLLF